MEGKMEIDFIIQWKDGVNNKTDLAPKVKEMLTDLFNNISDNSFSYTADDKISHLLEYQLSEKDKKAYLQVISAESEARASHTLSSIREIVSKGKHRKDFLIICSYDEASLSYCCRLMKPMGTFERHLRELMYLITTKAFGADWVKKTFPEEMIAGIKGRTHGNLSDEKITESAFEFLDYGEVTTYLFSKRYFECSPDYLIEEKLSDQSLNNLSKEKIISIISSHRKTTLWDKLFTNIKGVSEETIDKIREYRNDVMHHHTLNDFSFKDIRKEVQAADKIITQAIADIKNKIYTEEESKIVYSSIGYAITEMMRTISFTAKLNIPDIANAISSSFKKLGELYDFYSKIDFSYISKVFSETISAYSKLIDMNVSTFGPLLDSLPYKNASDEPKSDEKRDDSFNDIKQDDSVDKDDTNS